MPKLIKDGVIVDNDWALVTLPEDGSAAVLPQGKIIVPYRLWEENKEVYLNQSHVGVWLNSDEGAELIGEYVDQIPLIALFFPGFMDGRAFSTARLLRERYGFKGELRAVGNFIRDQLCYMRRVGVNSFAFANTNIQLDEALESLNDLTEYYQAAVDQPLPLFRRRD
jgi:uncharacterized protein (DUF934 family)